MVDAKGRPMKLLLSAGNRHDSLFAQDLVAGEEKRIILADKTYDTNAFRDFLAENGLTACIPPKADRKDPPSYDKEQYKLRHHVENCFQRLKEFRATATRYEKLDSRFLNLVTLAAILCW